MVCWEIQLFENLESEGAKNFVVQCHIYFLPYSVIKMAKVFAVYTDCTLITIQLSLVKYLSKIRQIIGYCPAVYFISEPTKIDFFVNYTYINSIILIYYYYYI